MGYDYFYETYDSPIGDVSYGLPAVSGIFLLCYCLVAVAGLAVAGFIYYRLAKKMGYNPWLGLLMLVPLANFVIPFIIIFNKWPIEEELEALKAKHSDHKKQDKE